MAIDVDRLVVEIKDVISHVLERDADTIRGFSERQVRALAQQAALVEAGIQSGQITEETREFFLDSLEDMALNCVKTLHGLVSITIEQVWNAVVGVIWRTLEAGTGLVLPLPGPSQRRP